MRLLWKAFSWTWILQREFWDYKELLYFSLISLISLVPCWIQNWIQKSSRIQILNNRALTYLADLIVPYYPNRALCFQIACLLLVSSIFKSRMWCRLFQTPLLWNEVWVWFWETDALSTFFDEAYSGCWIGWSWAISYAAIGLGCWGIPMTHWVFHLESPMLSFFPLLSSFNRTSLF